MPQPLVVQIFDGTAWVDQLTLSGTGTTITRGSDGESGSRASKFEITLNNDDGRYRTSDPMSPLYGLAGRNTRCRVRVGGVTRTQAEASSWRPGRSPEHKPGQAFGMAWCDLTAEGLLRRIGQWKTPLRSPLHRAISRYATLAGYWPMEDKAKATQLSNALAGGQAAILRGGEPAGIDGPAGSDSLLKIDAATSVVGTFNTIPVVGGWQVAFSAKLPALPASATFLPYMQWWTANGNRWTLDVNASSYQWTIIDRDGVLVHQFNVGFGAGAEPNQWVAHRVKVSQVGPNTQIETGWYSEASAPLGVLYGIASSFVGLTSAPIRWRVSGNVHNIGGGFGHVFAVRGLADDIQVPIMDAFRGHANERAATRYLRLLTEEDLTGYLTGVASDTAAMGPQRPGTLMQQLKEIIATEDAVIYDEPLDIALRMITRRVNYNQPVALALTWPDQIAQPLEEVTDDLGVANIVTVSNSRGGEYTASLEVGPLSTQAPPAGIGEAKTGYDVNVADETLQLQQLAEWYLGRSTIDRPRYPKVKVDLLAHPELIAAVNACDISDRITITGLEREVVDLIVVGSVEKVGDTTRTIEFTCLPADVQHHIGVYDDPGSRYDSASTSLAAAAAAGAVSMALTTVERADCWSTTETPYACVVAGERVTVTAMTAPAGTGPYTQTATVVRSLNGVVKDHVVGEPFSLADPVYAGL